MHVNASQTTPRATVAVLGFMQALSGRLPDILLRAGLAAPLAASLGVAPGDVAGLTRGWLGAALGVAFAILRGAPVLSSSGIFAICVVAATGMVMTTLADLALSGTTALAAMAVAQSVTGFVFGLTLTLRPAVLADRGPVGGANLAIERVSAAGGAGLVILAGAVASVWGWKAPMYLIAAGLVAFGALVALLWRDVPSEQPTFGRTRAPREVMAEVWSAMARPGVMASMIAGAVVYAGLGAVLIGVAIQLGALGTSPLAVAMVVSTATLVAAFAAGVFNPYAGPAPRAVAVAGFGWYVVAFVALAAVTLVANIWRISFVSLWWSQLALAWAAVMLVEFARSPVKAISHAAMQRLRGRETAAVASLATLLYWAGAHVGSWVAVVVPQETRGSLVAGAVLGGTGVVALTRATRRNVAHIVRAAGTSAVDMAVHVGPGRLLTLMIKAGNEWRVFNRVGCGGLVKLVRVEKSDDGRRSALRAALLVVKFDIPLPGPSSLWAWRFRAASDGASYRLPAWVPRDFYEVPDAGQLRVRLRRTRPGAIEAVSTVQTLTALDGGATSPSGDVDTQGLIEMLQDPELGLEVEPTTKVLHLRVTRPAGFAQPGDQLTQLEVLVLREEHHDTPVPPESAARRHRRCRRDRRRRSRHK